MFHHLDGAHQRAMLAETRRVLAPGGRLELINLARREERSHEHLARWLHSHERLARNGESDVIATMQHAGFEQARSTEARPRAACLGS